MAGKLDRWGRQHPRCMLAVTILMGIAVTMLLLSNTETTTVLYQAF